MSNGTLSMRVLIIEDETPAAEKLERYLQKYSTQIRIVDKLESIDTAVTWLQSRQNEIDLIFMDIQLQDGLSFKIFQSVKIVKPVIFITAYNEYALDAFRVNGIDYLLKPVTFTDLSESLKKLNRLESSLGGVKPSPPSWLPHLANRGRAIRIGSWSSLGITSNQ